jgi:thioredoxin-like negative regulator of GroEL
MAPIVHGLEAKYAGKLLFAYLDIDDPATNDFKAALGYRVQPHFFLVDGEGEVLQQWLGSVPEQELDQAFQAALGE